LFNSRNEAASALIRSCSNVSENPDVRSTLTSGQRSRISRARSIPLIPPGITMSEKIRLTFVSSRIRTAEGAIQFPDINLDPKTDKRDSTQQIGFEGRFDYSAIGTVINTAARLCDAAKDGQILVTSRIAAAVAEVADVMAIVRQGFVIHAQHILRQGGA